jgi:sugar phosphate permease
MSPSGQPVMKRAEIYTYATGTLNDAQTELVSFIIPLYAVALGFGPLELGILVSAKSILPSILSIHGGVLMDRYGTRLVMLMMGAACTLMPPLFIVASWFPTLLLLQMALGMVQSFGWIGAQALAVAVGKDNPRVLDRFSFFARVGVMVAPTLAGAMWDFLPHWISFVVIGAAGGAFWLAVRAIPPAATGEDRSSDDPRPPFRLRDIMPRLSDYIGAIGLMVIPVVAFVVVVSSVRIGSALMQQSFYIVYLKEIGLQATFIGLFVTLSQMMAAAGTLSGAWMSRFVPPHWVFLGMVTLSVILIYSTPVFGSALFILAIAIAVRGFAQGASQPVMYTILSRAVSRETQATAIGLRATGNRVAGITLPILMGAVAETWGLAATFFVTGGLLLLILGGSAIAIMGQKREGGPS